MNTHSPWLCSDNWRCANARFLSQLGPLRPAEAVQRPADTDWANIGAGLFQDCIFPRCQRFARVSTTLPDKEQRQEEKEVFIPLCYRACFQVSHPHAAAPVPGVKPGADARPSVAVYFAVESVFCGSHSSALFFSDFLLENNHLL